jgi:ketosteroid isomerase-like protein
MGDQVGDIGHNDLEAIKELHRRDVAATLAGSVDTLKALMDSECLVFPPDSEPEAGQGYLDRVCAVPASSESQAEILELKQDWEELRIFGDLAYELGTVSYTVRTAEDAVISETQRLMRILRRQSDGTWRVYRAMWHQPRPA